jgi:hypothetical protein
MYAARVMRDPLVHTHVKPYSLDELGELHPAVGKALSSLFLDTIYTEVSIFEVCNPTLRKRWLSATTRKTASPTGEQSIDLVYHGCVCWNVNSILERGWLLHYAGKSCGSTYGKGLYFSTDFTEALGYVPWQKIADNKEVAYVLVALVLDARSQCTMRILMEEAHADARFLIRLLKRSA